jgi:hypothetical protein
MSEIDWASLDTAPAASARMIQWHAPETYRVLREAIAREAWVSRTKRLEQRRADLDAQSVVYYVRLDGQRIKIGFTSNLKVRLAALRCGPSDLMACEPGGRELESNRHREFFGERINSREEFFPSERLLGWIEGVREEHGLPTWATLPDTKTITRKGVW